MTLEAIVSRLASADTGLVRPRSPGRQPDMPSQEAVAHLVRELRTVLFPGFFGTTSALSDDALRFHVGATLDRVGRLLQDQIRRAFCFVCAAGRHPDCGACEQRAEDAARHLVERLPEVQRILGTDVAAAYAGDPAATSPAETILCYPGILALMCVRIAHELYQLGVPLLPRTITEYAHGVTGIDIHPGASVGESCFIDHGTGVVIGETAIVGRRVRIYQGVTLGARSFPVDERGHLVKGIPRHPIVEDDVVIYGGATLLGRITIGAGSVIGGNVWLTRSVPPGSQVAQTEVRQARFTGGAGI